MRNLCPASRPTVRLPKTGLGSLSRRQKPKASSQGFALIEVSIALAILTLLAIYATPTYVEDYNERRAMLTAQETQAVVDAARAYRAKEGKWPGNATCSDALSVLQNTSPPMLGGAPEKNPYGSALATSCNSATFSVDQSAVSDWDSVIANLLPSTKIVDASTWKVRTTIGVPGSEPALNSKLSRGAESDPELNRMRTALLMGGNDIREVNGIQAEGDISSSSVTTNQVTTEGLTATQWARVSGSFVVEGPSNFTQPAYFDDQVVLRKVVVANTSCTQNGALARDSTGLTLSCQSGMWAKPVKNLCFNSELPGATGITRCAVIKYENGLFTGVCADQNSGHDPYHTGRPYTWMVIDQPVNSDYVTDC